jgi:hypothetical protein
LLGEDPAQDGAQEFLRAFLKSRFDLFAFQDAEEKRQCGNDERGNEEEAENGCRVDEGGIPYKCTRFLEAGSGTATERWGRVV